MEKNVYRRFSETDEFKKAAHRLKVWLGIVFADLVVSIAIGLVTYVKRGNFEEFGYIRELVQHFPGPARMISYMELTGKEDNINAASLNVFLCTLLQTMMLSMIFVTVLINRWRSNTFAVSGYVIFIVAMMLSIYSIPFLAPYNANNTKEHLNLMAFDQLVNGYLAYPILLPSSSFVIVIMLWLQGDLRK